MLRISREVKLLLGFHTAKQRNDEQCRDDISFRLALLEEFYRTALSVVTMASLANAIVRGVKVQLFGSINVYLPPDPTLHSAVTRNLVSANIDSDLLNDLHSFYLDVSVATARTNLSVRNIKPIHLTMASEWKALCREWQAACGSARRTLATITVTGDNEPRFMNRLEFLADTAKDAHDGGTPCVSGEGVVIVPGVLDRRASERVRIGVPMWLESNAGRQRVTLQDISEGGMGLAFCRELKTGMPVVAQLECGRRLPGFVVWAQSDRAGVSFATPLVAGDLLLVPRKHFG